MPAGDIASRDDEGHYFIVDRKKDLIITGGFNVYPAEIERVVASHPAVAMVAVGSVPDETLGELARAYVVLRPGATASQAQIIEHCRPHLAAYKLPRSIRFVPDLPKTSTGKEIRRRARTAGPRCSWTGARRTGRSGAYTLPRREATGELRRFDRQRPAGVWHGRPLSSERQAGAAIGLMPARSARRSRIVAMVMISVSSMIPAATSRPREKPTARAWSVMAGRDRCCPDLAAAVFCDRRLLANVLHATVPSTASPIEPPTCWPVLSRLDATPAVCSSTLTSAVRFIGTNTKPRPNAVTIIGPRIPPA